MGEREAIGSPYRGTGGCDTARMASLEARDGSSGLTGATTRAPSDLLKLCQERSAPSSAPPADEG